MKRKRPRLLSGAVYFAFLSSCLSVKRSRPARCKRKVKAKKEKEAVESIAHFVKDGV